MGGGLNNYFLIVEHWKSQIGVLSCLGSGKGSRPGVQMAIFLLCPSMAERGRGEMERRDREEAEGRVL